LLRADLHVHTRHSKDSTSSPQKIVQHCLDTGINCLAVTDHDTISGALELESIAPFLVIVGEEIMTTGGEIIGLFLKEQIAAHQSPEGTAAQIKDQGGLVCIPHPFDRFRPHSRIRADALKRITSEIDLVEVFNSRTFMLKDSARALEFAREHGFPGTVGSDAHVEREVGRAYMEMPEFNGVEEFQASLRLGRMFTRRTSVIVHFYNIRNRIVKLRERT
jgi:predicted metal-dependent phosphoesterase TrpH